jgi:hypothetical protein
MVAVINICTYIGIRSRGNVVSVADTLRLGRSGVCNVAGQDTLLFSLSPGRLWGPRKFSFSGNGVSFLSGIIPIFSLYAFMSWTGKTLFLCDNIYKTKLNSVA